MKTTDIRDTVKALGLPIRIQIRLIADTRASTKYHAAFTIMVDVIKEQHASILMHLMKKVFGMSCRSSALSVVHYPLILVLPQRAERLYTLSAQ